MAQMQLSSRLSALKSQTGPIFLDDDLPPFWLRNEHGRAIAIFEGALEFSIFDDVCPLFSGFDHVELTNAGTIRIDMGYVQ